MNLATFNTRLSRATKSHTVRRLVADLCLLRADTVRPCHTTGSGKRTKNSDHTPELRRTLEKMGIDYAHGNDAPKGGATGQWVALTPKGRGVTRDAAQQWQAERDAQRDHLKAMLEKEAKERATRYADKAGDSTAVLLQWWREKAFHPVPEPVLKAKQESGLSWKEVRTMCKSLSTNP